MLDAELESGMAQVEAAIREAVVSEYPFVTEASRHLVDAGGKRFRPLLVLLAAQFGSGITPDVIKAAGNLQSHATSNVANVSQVAALAAVSGGLEAVDEMKVAFDRRRLLIVDMLNAIPGVECPTPEGAFYVYPSVKGLLGRSINGRTASTSAELAAIILEEAEVAVVPGEAFGTNGYLRLSYATSDADITEGVGRMQRLLG